MTAVGPTRDKHKFVGINEYSTSSDDVCQITGVTEKRRHAILCDINLSFLGVVSIFSYPSPKNLCRYSLVYLSIVPYGYMG